MTDGQAFSRACWTTAAAMHHVKSAYRLAITLMQEEGYESHDAWIDSLLSKTAAGGHVPSMSLLGDYLLRSKDATRWERGESWLSKAAAEGYSVARGTYGFYLVVGERVRQDREAGEKMLRAAAEEQHIPSLRLLAHLLQLGELAEARPHEAVDFLRRAAELGDQEAMWSLGTRGLSVMRRV